MRGAIAGVVVVLGAAVAAWWLWPESETRQDAASTKKALIKEVKPAPAPVAKVEQEEKPKPPPRRPEDALLYKYGGAIGPDGKTYFVPRPGHRLVTNGLHRVKPAYAIFKRHYQNELASYLTAKPGELFLGEMTYDDDFVKEVVETMSLPIPDDEKDTPEQRDLKARMREVLKAVREEVDAGRDVRDIFRETREELQKLGEYKLIMEQEVKEAFHSEDRDDKDVEDLIDAANKMLEEKGIAPLEFGELAKEIIRTGTFTIKENVE